MEAALPPWSQPDLLPAKPADDSYGYVRRGKLTSCPREALIQQCRDHFSSPETMLVWAPETTRIVPAIELPLLHDTIRERTRKLIRFNLTSACFGLFGYGLPVLLSSNRRAAEYQLLLLLSFALIPLTEGWWRLRQMDRETPETVTAQTISVRYGVWIGRQRKEVTWVLFSVILIVFVFQMVHGLDDSIRRAGLTKTGLHPRDAYRFLTATLMHGGVMHILMNGMSLFILGMVVEALLGGAAMALIFTASALGGSALSFIASSQTTVGASGGIMGLLGCVAVLGIRFHKIFPPKYGRQIIYAALLTALTGVAARHVIDNAAHAGGLLVGAALGWTLVRSHSSLPLQLPLRIRWAGRLAVASIVAAAVFIVVLLWRT